MSTLIVPVVKISKIEKHPNADTLSIVNFDGYDWNCIVRTEDFKEGDLAIYIPIDSIVPESLIEEYNLSYLKKGSRIMTVKLRGIISQGLLLQMKDKKFSLGKNVAQDLGITKWEPPAPKYQGLNGKKMERVINPHFSRYTNIENIKNYSGVFEDGEDVVIREKIHGSNWRAAKLPRQEDRKILRKIINKIKKMFGKLDPYEFVYGSHNVQWGVDEYGDDIYGRIAKRYNMIKVIPNDYVVYGEVYGAGVQDLTYGLKDIELAVFGVTHKGNYLSDYEMVRFCTERNLPMAPLLYKGPFNKEIVIQLTDGKSTLCSTQIREGIVVTSATETFDRRVGRKILKSISVDYLTRKNGTEYH